MCVQDIKNIYDHISVDAKQTSGHEIFSYDS